MMREKLTRNVWAGQALYTPFFLYIYNWFALGLNCRFIWECPTKHVIKLYNQYISGNHLDIGVGTGYFLEKCIFPITKPRLVLVDLNPNSLVLAQKRLVQYQPQVYRRNILEPLNLNIDTLGFDSIGITHILHCLPGNMQTKGIVFQHVKSLLNPGGILFGATLLYKGVKRNPLATYLFWWTNVFGFMTNKQDDLEGLEENLRAHFSESHIEVIGCEALFWARK
ncbi:class I SAM-dependent methyltransferase [Chloroflexota bacterium]